MAGKKKRASGLRALNGCPLKEKGLIRGQPVVHTDEKSEWLDGERKSKRERQTT